VLKINRAEYTMCKFYPTDSLGDTDLIFGDSYAKILSKLVPIVDTAGVVERVQYTHTHRDRSHSADSRAGTTHSDAHARTNDYACTNCDGIGN
jgi:hypothetical protein